MSGYAKLFSSILHSTIWLEENHVRLVWITMLAMANRRGIVEASVPGLAVAARVSLAECEAALAKFLGPDKHSRSKEHEGRRIAEVDGGWVLLNYEKRRNEQSAESARENRNARQQRWREKRNGELENRIEERDGSRRCAYCGSPRDLTIDHVIPTVMNGPDHLDNLVFACRSCNCGKGGMTPEMAGMATVYSNVNVDALSSNVDAEAARTSTSVDATGSASASGSGSSDLDPDPDRAGEQPDCKVLPSGRPIPRRSCFPAMVLREDYEPHSTMTAWAFGMGLDQDQVEGVTRDLRDKHGLRPHTLDWWDERWLRFAETAAKPNGSRQASAPVLTGEDFE